MILLVVKVVEILMITIENAIREVAIVCPTVHGLMTARVSKLKSQVESEF